MTKRGAKHKRKILGQKEEIRRQAAQIKMLSPGHDKWVSLRPVIQEAAEAMEACLQLNDHKWGWHTLTLFDLAQRLLREVDELKEAIEEKNVVAVQREATDIANYAAFLIHNARVFKEKLDGKK